MKVWLFGVLFLASAAFARPPHSPLDFLIIPYEDTAPTKFTDSKEDGQFKPILGYRSLDSAPSVRPHRGIVLDVSRDNKEEPSIIVSGVQKGRFLDDDSILVDIGSSYSVALSNKHKKAALKNEKRSTHF